MHSGANAQTSTKNLPKTFFLEAMSLLEKHLQINAALGIDVEPAVLARPNMKYSLTD